MEEATNQNHFIHSINQRNKKIHFFSWFREVKLILLREIKKSIITVWIIQIIRGENLKKWKTFSFEWWKLSSGWSVLSRRPNQFLQFHFFSLWEWEKKLRIDWNWMAAAPFPQYEKEEWLFNGGKVGERARGNEMEWTIEWNNFNYEWNCEWNGVDEERVRPCGRN